MKRNTAIGILLCIVLIIPLLFTGCFGTTSKSTSSTPSITDQIAKAQSKADSAASAAATAKNKADDAYALAQKANDKATPDTYTKDEIDGKFDGFIANLSNSEIESLKDKIGINEDNSGSSSNNSGDSNSDLIDSDRSLRLYLEKMSPDSDPFRLDDGGDSVTFDVIVENTDDDNHYFKLTLWIEPEKDTKVIEADTEIVTYSDLDSWTWTRADWNTTANRGKITFTMDNDCFINDDNSDDYTVVVNINSTVDTFWSFRWTIEETD